MSFRKLSSALLVFRKDNKTTKIKKSAIKNPVIFTATLEDFAPKIEELPPPKTPPIPSPCSS